MKWRYVLLWLILGGVLFCTSCNHIQAGTAHYFSYREEIFCAEICGQLNGISFSAEIGRTEAFDETNPLANTYIQYLHPTALKGIRLQYDRLGNPCASLDEISYPLTTADIAQGWLSPLEFLLTDAEILRVTKEKEETVLKLPKAELRLSKEGLPLSLYGEEMEIKTVWWQAKAR